VVVVLRCGYVGCLRGRLELTGGLCRLCCRRLVGTGRPARSTLFKLYVNMVF